MDSNITPLQPEFEFIGGNLCLDFANTLGGLPPDSPTQDRLTSYSRLVIWSQHANLLSESDALVLLRKAEAVPVEAATVLERAQAMRNAIRSIFLAVDRGIQPTSSDLDAFNSELARGMSGARVMPTMDGFAWEWRTEADSLDQMLATIARSAATLLTSAERQLMRKCANDLCNWLFVDTTKNHRRQWCKTAGCGNMMRVRKFRERQRDKK